MVGTCPEAQLQVGGVEGAKHPLSPAPFPSPSHQGLFIPACAVSKCLKLSCLTSSSGVLVLDFVVWDLNYLIFFWDFSEMLIPIPH